MDEAKSKRKRSNTFGGEKAASVPLANADEIVYVFPPRFDIVGKALLPMVNGLRKAMEPDAGPPHPEFVIPESIYRHMELIQRVLERLPSRVGGLFNDSVSGDESDIACVYLAAGRLEGLLSEWVDGYQMVMASHAQPEIGEVRDLLLGVYRHHLLEVCDWLADLVKVIANPAVAMKKSGLQMGESATLTVSLSVTVPPEMAKLLEIVKRMQIETAPALEPIPATQRTVQSGPGLLGTIGALAFGLGVTKAVLGRHPG